MKQRVALAGTAVLLAAGLAACGPGDDPDAGAAEAPYVFGPEDEYVALGDSYTAAPNTGPYDGRDGCFRSRVNYPHRVAEAIGMTLHDNSCSGANTSSLTHAQRTVTGTHPPQLEGLDSYTDLVTIRLGANDYALFARLVRCARLYGAEADGSPCTDLDAAAGDLGVAARLDDVESRLVQSFAKIEDRAPEARIIVIGYPRIVPAEGRCDLLPLPAGDYDFARRLNEGLNTAAANAAEQSDLEFIDVFGATDGHDICSDDPWIAGIRVIGADATPWHPYPQESEAVAELLLDRLES